MDRSHDNDGAGSMSNAVLAHSCPQASAWLPAGPLQLAGLGAAGQPVRLIGADQPWEAGQVEAPSMALVGDRYVLLYSATGGTRTFTPWVSRCATPRSARARIPTGSPIVTSKKGALGPGGADMFSDVSGQLLVAYHAWTPSVGPPGHRSLWIARATDLGIAG